MTNTTWAPQENDWETAIERYRMADADMRSGEDSGEVMDLDGSAHHTALLGLLNCPAPDRTALADKFEAFVRQECFELHREDIKPILALMATEIRTL
ncbi:MAG: hypothetical protein AB8B54_10025 [Sphingorhabdus sp.]